MGYFDGLSANLVQTGTDGKRYYAPAGKCGPLYLLSTPEAENQLRREWRAFFIVFFVLLMLALTLAGPARVVTAGWRLFVVPAALGGVVAVLFGLVAARRLPRATISHGEPYGSHDRKPNVHTPMRWVDGHCGSYSLPPWLT